MSESVQIVGTLNGIMEKPSGWFQVEIEVPGKQYPVKADTKKSEIIEAVRAVGTEMATWTITESESENVNPNSGKPYINRYLEGVEVGGSPTEADTAGGSPERGRYSEEEVARFEAKERRDYRSRAWAQTLGAFTHTIKVDEPAEDVFARLQPFQRKVYEDVCGMFAYPPDESDIPF